MQIQLSHIGKRYNREWIFRNIDYCFQSNEKYAIIGANGSGKSTLLQIIGGALMHSEGKINFTNPLNNSLIEPETAYRHIAFSAPYLELLEEMTAQELLDFNSKFKKMVLEPDAIFNAVGLQKAQHKQIRYFSSGMKQRLKLALAFFSDTSVVLLDEPTSNLDETGIDIYLQLINSHTKNRTVIVCSNEKKEYAFCEHILQIDHFKFSS
jgi:ABC-type multidrug transport system ATPase subunit